MGRAGRRLLEEALKDEGLNSKIDKLRLESIKIAQNLDPEDMKELNR
jgi:hypothetical protein